VRRHRDRGPIRRRPEPPLEADWFAEGSLGVPLDYDSYWTPQALRTADRIYTDDTGQFEHARAEGSTSRSPALYADLGEVVAARRTAAARRASVSSA